MRFTTWTTAVVALLPLTGCGGGEERLAISGKVLFKGEPLDQGRIDFVPPNNAGSLSGAVVENGAFSIPRDKGLLPGTYLVRVYSYDRKGAKVPDPIPGDPGSAIQGAHLSEIQCRYHPARGSAERQRRLRVQGGIGSSLRAGERGFQAPDAGP